MVSEETKARKKEYMRLKRANPEWATKDHQRRQQRKERHRALMIVRQKTPEQKAKHKKWEIAYRKNFQKKVIEHYGGKCACCGDTTTEFLSIDHINGGGRKHKEEVGGSTRLYRWLIANSYPDGFRVLCMNCNWSLGMKGYCPHEKDNYLDRIGW